MDVEKVDIKNKPENLKICFQLGYEQAIHGRVELPSLADTENVYLTDEKPFSINLEKGYVPGEVAVGHGRTQVVNYYKQYSWLSELENSALKNGGEIEQKEVRLSSVCPARDWYGQIGEEEAGITGGFIVDYADILYATWSAVGGIAGITAFLKMIKEFKSLWESSVKVEIEIDERTKLTLSKPGDVEKALRTLERWEKQKVDNQ